MSIPIRYVSLHDYQDLERSYSIKQSTAPNGDTIAKAVVNGHPFEARHASPQKATRALTTIIEDADNAGLTLEPPKPA
jgi:hypothetical protein